MNRIERARELMTVDAWNDAPERRLDTIAELFKLGAEATADGWIAEAQGYAYECTERLKAHSFMVREVEKTA